MRLSASGKFILLIAGAAVTLWPARPAVAGDDLATVAARNDFAEHVAEIGQNWLRTGAKTAANYQEAIVMLRAAQRSAPKEPRYPRQLAFWLGVTQDVDGEIAAWGDYRNLAPDDRVAAVRVIELYGSRMQTADKELGYYKDMVANTALPPEVRAYIASLCVPLLQQRSDSDALAMIDQGIKLYPLPDLLHDRYMLVSKDADPLERVRGLLGLLRSNPLQLEVLDQLARELANNGLHEESAEWMNVEFELGQRMGVRRDPQFFVDLLSELYLGGQVQSAQRMVNSLLDADRNNADFRFLSLTFLRSAHDRAGYIEAVNSARSVFRKQWVDFDVAIFSKEGAAATQPAGDVALDSVPDPVVALAQLRQRTDHPEWADYFTVSMQNLAWFELYYAGQPQLAQIWINALQKDLPADDPKVARLVGWYELETGKTAAAREHLSAIADHDPLAALGLIQLNIADRAGARDKLRELLHENPTGLLAAMLNEALLAEEAPAPPTTGPTTGPTTNPVATTATTGPAAAPATQPAIHTPLAESIRAELKKFPAIWLNLMALPQQFYTLSAEPMQTTVPFGAPLLGRVTLTNRTDYDLVIGFDGPIQPDLFISAKVTGIAQQDFAAVAYDQLTGVIVLRGHGELSQVMRIDQGELGELLCQRANGTMLVGATVMTNPVRVEAGALPSAGGEAALFGRNFVRQPSELQPGTAERQLRDDFTVGSPLDRMKDLESLGAFVQGMDKETDQGARALADVYLRYIMQARHDANPEVAAWGGYLSATLPGMPDRAGAIQEMLRSPSWQTRLLAIAAARNQPADVQERLCGPVAASDPDALPKSLAAATLDALSQPTTAPTTQPK